MASQSNARLLYHHPYSICSIMVRYAFACRGNPTSDKETIELSEKMVDILHGEQLTEHFLCDVNVNGEVPVLVPPNGRPIPESVDITFYLAERYPSLLPPSQAEEIKRLIKLIHSISFFSLTFTGRPEGQQAAKKQLQAELDSNSISERYRAAINTKLQRIDAKKLPALTDESVNNNIKRTREVLLELETLVKNSETDWCLGLPEPSALDAHLIVFIARLQDVDRGELVPEALKQYAKKAMERPEWKEVMQGRTTTSPLHL